MIVLLVGTKHSHQLVGYKNGAAETFKTYLESLCDAEAIDLLAEELNDEAIARWKAQDSTVRLLAAERKIAHMFCDPDSTERRVLGIPTYAELRAKYGYGRNPTSDQEANLQREERSHWSVREAFWLTKVAASSTSRCLFVLGAAHVQSFANFLSSREVTTEIRACRWEP